MCNVRNENRHNKNVHTGIHFKNKKQKNKTGLRLNLIILSGKLNF